MKIDRGLAAILGLMAAALAVPAAAQDDSGLYLGGSAGYSQYNNSCKNLVIPCDGNDTAWRGFAGYQINRYLALEVGYANLGEVVAKGDVAGFGTVTSTREVEAWDGSLVYMIPVAGQLSILGRLGAYRARTVDETTGAFPALSSGHTNSGFTVGLGAGLMLWKFGLRAEWQHYQNVGGGDTGKDDIDVFSVGALIRF
jgi:OOP family OmpA-OmpF porin